jgi:hypothetical protein
MEDTSFDASEFDKGTGEIITSGSLSEASGKSFFSADQLTGPETHEIKGFRKVSFTDKDTGETRNKRALVFADVGRHLTLNATMEGVLRDLFGDRIEDMIGKSVELYKDSTQNPQGMRVSCVRLRATR